MDLIVGTVPQSARGYSIVGELLWPAEFVWVASVFAKSNIELCPSSWHVQPVIWLPLRPQAFVASSGNGVAPGSCTSQCFHLDSLRILMTRVFKFRGYVGDVWGDPPGQNARGWTSWDILRSLRQRCTWHRRSAGPQRAFFFPWCPRKTIKNQGTTPWGGRGLFYNQ